MKYYKAKTGTLAEKWLGDAIVIKGNQAMSPSEDQWFVKGLTSGTIVPANELEETEAPPDYDEKMKREWGSK